MRPELIIPVLVLVIAALLVGAAIAAAQAYQLDWWTADNGGGATNGGIYSLSGTIGQPDAGSMAGGEYTLAGGFSGARQSPSKTKAVPAPGEPLSGFRGTAARGQLVV